MKFPVLDIENFLAISEARVSLDGQGLVGVSADNQDDSSADSNGTGKSSLVDALSWCLWGTTARGVSGDDVVSWFVGKGQGTRVAVTVDDDGQLYQVVRHRSYPKHKHSLQLFREDNGAWVDLTKGTTGLTQKLVQRMLGCSEEVFNAAVYSGQEAMPDIPGMTDKELKLLVEQAAGVDVLSSAYEIAKERTRRASEKRAQHQIALDRANDRLIAANEALSSAATSAQQWDGSHAGKIEAAKTEAIGRTAAYQTAAAAIDPKAATELDARIAAVQARIDAVAAERQRETDLQSTYNGVSSSFSIAQANLRTQTQALDIANETAASVSAKVGTPCRECKKPIAKADIIALQESADERVKDMDAEVATRTAKLAAAEKMLNDADETLVAHREGMTDISGATAEMNALQREQQILARQDSEVARLKDQARAAAQTWKTAEAETNPFLTMIAGAKANIAERVKALEVSNTDTLASIEDENYARAVADVFAPAGVRARRLDEATPYLNQRTTHYLGSLTDGSIEAHWTTLTETKDKKELREKFSVTVEKVSAQGKGSFKNISGGEKRKVRLACALALQDLVANRAAKSIDLWIGDEIDDALDDAGIERLMGVLEEKARDRGTVLVISHNDIKDFCRRSFVITKVNERATVTES